MSQYTNLVAANTEKRTTKVDRFNTLKPKFDLIMSILTGSQTTENSFAAYVNLFDVLSAQIDGHEMEDEIEEESQVNEGFVNENLTARGEAFRILEVLSKRGRPRNSNRSFFTHQPLQNVASSTSDIAVAPSTSGITQISSISITSLLPTDTSTQTRKKRGRKGFAEMTEEDLTEHNRKKSQNITPFFT